MAYVSGTATDLTSLRLAIISACTANGWALDGVVLYKDTNYLTLTVTGNYLDLLGGTGVSSGALTGDAPSASRIGSVSSGTSYLYPLAWPLSYEVFINTAPDEVVVVLNYSTDRYQWLAWGKSTVPLPGTGMWFGGTMEGGRTQVPAGITYGIHIDVPATLSEQFGARSSSSQFWGLCPALFHATILQFGNRGEHIHHNLTGGGWSGNDADVVASRYRFPLDRLVPSAWNSETVLLPIQPYSGAYGSNKVAMVADMAHIRACRIDNNTPGDIVTLGSDRWKIYPWYSKNRGAPTGGMGLTHSGCIGFAVRYDGP